jgi:hypothetical protein
MATFGTALAGSLDLLVTRVILPVTSVIPFLVRTGLLMLGFVVLWLAFLGAMVADPGRLDEAWRTITGLSFVGQALAWLLFLPLMAGLWVWSTDWPLLVRIVIVVAIAGWNLVAFLPRRESASAPTAQ